MDHRVTGIAQQSYMNMRRTATATDVLQLAPALRLGQLAPLQIDRLKEDCVVYQPEQERVHSLNPTAAAALDLCAGHHGFADIEARVAARFARDKPDHNLTGEILHRFLAEGLVLLEAEPAALTESAPSKRAELPGRRTTHISKDEAHIQEFPDFAKSLPPTFYTCAKKGIKQRV